MSHIHIHAPRGYYIGMLRGYGCRKWRTASGRCRTAESAMIRALRKMRRDDKRARVIFCTYDGWYGPDVVMELNR